MSRTSDTILKLLPEKFRQRLRTMYYNIKLFRAQPENEPDLLLISELVEPGSCLVDVGANYGIYTRFFSEYAGREGKVISLEPIDKTFDCLSSNVKKLRLSNVSLHKLALSDRAGESFMEIPDYQQGGENMYEARIVDVPQDIVDKRTVKINTSTLDNLLKDEKVVDFIKIDVEGHELNVLKGGLEVLEKFKPMMLLEINGGINKQNENAQSILSLLHTLDYQPFIRKDGQLQAVTNESDGFNFFFLTPDHAAKNERPIAKRSS